MTSNQKIKPYFASLKNRGALYLLLTANAISGFAQGISIIAVPWYFASQLNEEEYYGWAYTIITGITLFWSLYVGTLVDRYSRKGIFLSLNAAGLIALGSVAATGFYFGEVPKPLVMLAFGVTVFIFNIHYPTLYAFGQEITEKQHYGKINSLLEVQGQATSMLAGAFAAVLLSGTGASDFALSSIITFEVEPWTLQEIFLLDTCTYAVAFTLIAFIRYQPTIKNEVDTSGLIQRFRSGVKFLKGNKPLLWFGFASYAVFIILIVQAFFLMSMYVDNHLEKSGFTFALGEILYAGGALLAGIFIRKLFAKVNPLTSITLLMVVTTGILLMMAFTKHPSTFYAFTFTLGLTNAGIRILRVTFLFELVPNRMIGRSFSIFNSFNILCRTLLIALFSIPFFSTGSNVVWAYLILAIFVAIALIPMIGNHQVLKNYQKLKEEN